MRNEGLVGHVMLSLRYKQRASKASLARGAKIGKASFGLRHISRVTKIQVGTMSKN